jgi:hypothetical protein
MFGVFNYTGNHRMMGIAAFTNIALLLCQATPAPLLTGIAHAV